jgi:lauroyl/myristoyl acyltransferase
MGRVKAWFRDAVAQVSEAYRVLSLLLLRAAAAYLPLNWAMALADAVGFGLAVTPIGARARQSMRAMFHSTGENAAKLAREYLTRPFRDYVIARQIVEGREKPAHWPVESRGEPAILKAPGQSLIIAAGHFSRQAMSGIYVPALIPKKLSTVVAALDAPSGLRGLRLRLQLGAMVAGIRLVREGDVDVVEIGKPGVVTGLLRRLRTPGGVVIIASDASWPEDAPGGIERAFAGYGSNTLALGTARLSRLAQCPIVTCVPFLDSDGHVVLEWGDVIPAPARDDEAADARITNAILDTIERAVGRRPGQYVLPIGQGRRWSAVAECWIEGASPSAPNGLAHAQADAAKRAKQRTN